MKRFFTVVGIVVVVLLLFSHWGAGLYTNWLWFKSLNYQQVFATILISDLALKVIMGLLFFMILLINLLLTRNVVLKSISGLRLVQEGEVVSFDQSAWSQFINKRNLTLLFTAISFFLAFLVATSAKGDWLVFQNFLNPSEFNTVDPIFKKDIGFYVFQFPFYQFIYRQLIFLVVLSFIFAGAVYYLAGAVREGFSAVFRPTIVRYHLSILAAVFFFIRAWGYRLEQYALLYSERSGVHYGPGYADINATLVAYKILFVLSLVFAVIILINIFLRRFRLVVYTVVSLVVVSIVMGGVYPALVQQFIVVPNQMEREKPYIENNIRLTRMAYNLDLVEKKSFPAGRTLNPGDIRDNRDTVDNIRLWDYRPLQRTYSQLQEMRQYYELRDIDVDRYVIDGRYRQVMLSARELNQNQLPDQAKTWVNQRFKYTHGYGIVMSPVNEATSEGLPRFFMKDIPPTTETDLEVKRPEIYFGELTDNFVVVKAGEPEFDYPQGNENVYSTYLEDSGVSINNLLRRLIFALSFSDYKLLLTGDITRDSKILYYRNIQERVRKIAPFLAYDHDPYIVLARGKLYWLWDAYTVSDMYPYSEPFRGRLNYIRNAVKVVTDAYTGDVTFYIADAEDPVVKTYSKIFPRLFKDISQMPPEIKEHIRYPEDLFRIQAEKYALYHMQDYRVFYNKEDKWTLPSELFGEEEQPMEPYYTIVRIPGEKQPEFVLIIPFTPQNKKNMIGWLAARSDGEHYGKLLAYEFPKQALVYGPMQVEARINSDTNISQQVTLWDQRGSNVLRGNLLVIPIKDSLLYVEPLYLESDQTKIPELRRVIVTHGEKVVMEPTLGQALARIFGQDELPAEAADAGDAPPERRLSGERSITKLIGEANRLYEEAQSKVRAGDWDGYGKSLQRLKATLEEMANIEGSEE